MVTKVTPGYIWSQVATFVTVEVIDLDNDGLDIYFDSILQYEINVGESGRPKAHGSCYRHR